VGTAPRMRSRWTAPTSEILKLGSGFSVSGVVPWAKPRYELALLALVAVAALTPLYVESTQDLAHYCLSQAIVAGLLDVEPCAGGGPDIAFYGGHIYSNKAPGMSLLSIPAVEAVRLPAGSNGIFPSEVRLWAVRVLTSGLAFLVCAFLVGRVAEGLAPGTGGAVLVTFALGTFVAPFAAAGFDHVPTAMFAFGAFLLAWSRRPLLAGLSAGLAYFFEYEAAAIVLLIAIYVLLLGWRPLGRYVLGVFPGVAISGAYSWIAFGRPWRIPQHYDLFSFADVKPGGLLGVHAPTLRSIRLVFVGDRGLLVATPVVVAAAVGLWLLWRQGWRAEALLCAAVTAAFVIGETGYGDPYGGVSAGLRYMIPSLPFLALGLAPMYARWRALTACLAGISIVAIAGLTATWASTSTYPHTIWYQLYLAARRGADSNLYSALTNNVLGHLGASAPFAELIVLIVTVAAFAFALTRGYDDDRMGTYAEGWVVALLGVASQFSKTRGTPTVTVHLASGPVLTAQTITAGPGDTFVTMEVYPTAKDARAEMVKGPDNELHTPSVVIADIRQIDRVELSENTPQEKETGFRLPREPFAESGDQDDEDSLSGAT
jgi:hypothetical protein